MEISSLLSSISLSTTNEKCGCFRKVYLNSATEQEVRNHLIELYERCQYEHNAAKYAAMYIYEETEGVFNHMLRTNEIYDWLKNEFGLRASRENFYKACQLFRAYTNRK